MDVKDALKTLGDMGFVFGGEDCTVTVSNSRSQGDYRVTNTITATFGACDVKYFAYIVETATRNARFSVQDGEVGRS